MRDTVLFLVKGYRLLRGGGVGSLCCLVVPTWPRRGSPPHRGSLATARRCSARHADDELQNLTTIDAMYNLVFVF